MLSTLAFHEKWILGILLFSLGLNLAVGLYCVARRFIFGKKSLPSKPMYPGINFPTPVDALYLVLFFLYMGKSMCGSIYSQAEASYPQYNALPLLIGFLITGGLYLPMMLRIALLHRLTRKDVGAIELNLPPIRQTSPVCSNSFGRDMGLVALAVTLSLVSAGIYEHSGLMDLIVNWSDCPLYQTIVDIIKKGGTDVKIIVFIGAVIIAPLGEECCFRGFLYGTLRKYAGRATAAVCSSLLFAAVHLSLAQTLPLFLFALLQCYIYEKSHSLRAPILAHALFNTIQVLAAIMLFSGE